MTFEYPVWYTHLSCNSGIYPCSQAVQAQVLQWQTKLFKLSFEESSFTLLYASFPGSLSLAGLAVMMGQKGKLAL